MHVECRRQVFLKRPSFPSVAGCSHATVHRTARLPKSWSSLGGNAISRKSRRLACAIQRQLKQNLGAFRRASATIHYRTRANSLCFLKNKK